MNAEAPFSKRYRTDVICWRKYFAEKSLTCAGDLKKHLR